MFVLAATNYVVYLFRTMKKIIPCPMKNDYYFDYR